MASTARRYANTPLSNVENIENYGPGGFHRVILGDIFRSRYKVFHKLGYGSFSTVWLARDLSSNRYVALKILEADSSANCKELEQLKILASVESEHEGKRHVVRVLDDFMIEGPNGRHLVLVMDVADPSIASFHIPVDFERGPRRLEVGLARKMSKQLVHAVDFLHSQGLCHGG